MTWWPQFRVIDTATVTPDPEVAAAVAGFEQKLTREMDVPLGTTAVELDSRNATVRTREAAIGNLIADAMRDDCACRRRDPQRRRHPRRQDLCAGRRRSAGATS